MARLTNYDRERILKGLRPSFQVELEKVKRALSDLINEFLIKEIPGEIFLFMKKYPNLLYSSKTIYIPLNQGSLYLSVIEYPSNYIKTVYFIKSKDNTGEISRSLDLLLMKAEAARILEKKVSCVLDNISTEKRLKDEFPEAYKVYTKSDETEDTQNMCDSIENVRAELSKIKGEGKE